MALSRKMIERARRDVPAVTPNVFAFFALCEQPIRDLVERVAVRSVRWVTNAHPRQKLPRHHARGLHPYRGGKRLRAACR
ncbi:MAG: hypothetical protein WDN06_14135 [Asticcacaulis sp.]